MNGFFVFATLFSFALAVPTQIPLVSRTQPRVPLNFKASIFFHEYQVQHRIHMQNLDKQMSKLYINETSWYPETLIIQHAENVYQYIKGQDGSVTCIKSTFAFSPLITAPKESEFYGTKFFNNALADAYVGFGASMYFDATSGKFLGMMVNSKPFIVESLEENVDDAEFNIPEHIACKTINPSPLETTAKKFWPLMT